MKAISQYFGVNIEFQETEDLIEKVNALVAASKLSMAEIDTLFAAWKHGCLESGDTPSKDGRSKLLDKGILCQVSNKQCDYGFSVTYPFGYRVIMAFNVLKQLCKEE